MALSSQRLGCGCDIPSGSNSLGMPLVSVWLTQRAPFQMFLLEASSKRRRRELLIRECLFLPLPNEGLYLVFNPEQLSISLLNELVAKCLCSGPARLCPAYRLINYYLIISSIIPITLGQENHRSREANQITIKRSANKQGIKGNGKLATIA